MKQWAGFILLNGKIEAKEVKTKDFTKMSIPRDAIGCTLISLCEPIKFGRPLIDNLEIFPITYFGEKCVPDGCQDNTHTMWIKTRLGTYMQVDSNAKVIKL